VRARVIATGVAAVAVLAVLALPAGALAKGRVVPKPDTIPSQAPCPTGETPVTISRVADLQDAVGFGAAKLQAKGGFGGDVMAVTGEFRDVRLPIRVRVNIEVTPPDSSRDWAALMQQTIESKLAGSRITDPGPDYLTPITFEINTRTRAPGAPPTPCFHEVRLINDPKYRSASGPNGLQFPSGGVWTTQDINEWTHETGHLMGLEDQYADAFVVGNKGAPQPTDKVVPLSKNGLSPAQVKKELKAQGLKPSDGYVKSLINPGHENDVMAYSNNPGARLSQRDLMFFNQLGRNSLTIRARPGDLLAAKDGHQNLGVGAPFELTVKRDGGPVRVDGMVAYCIDLRRHSPSMATAYDALGPAAQFADSPGMQALQRVLDQAAAREPAPLQSTPGAQTAVWRVTDDEPLTDFGGGTDAPAREILAAANVPDDAAYNTPHYDNPNAGSPESGAVAPGGVKTVAPPEFPPVARLDASLAGRQRGRKVRVKVTVADAPDVVSVVIERRVKRRWFDVAALSGKALDPGSVTLSVPVRLRKGSYRAVVVDDSGRRLLPFKVT
jgi:hypothetical protein